MECHFDPDLYNLSPRPQDIILQWYRHNSKTYEAVAFNHQNSESGSYTLDFNPTGGKYDLTINATKWERDNGVWTCLKKSLGGLSELISYQLNVLGKIIIIFTKHSVKSGTKFKVELGLIKFS